MRDCGDRARVPAPGAESLVLGLEVGVFGAAGGGGGFDQVRAQPFGVFAGFAGAAFAGGFVVAGADAGPLSGRSRKYDHVLYVRFRA